MKKILIAALAATTLFSCTRKQTHDEVIQEDTQVQEVFADMPYTVFRDSLYTYLELFDVFDPAVASSFDSCYDTRVYHHMVNTGTRPKSFTEAMARSVHDTKISNAMAEFLAGYDPKRVVGIMGGHSSLRTDDSYRTTVLIAKELTEQGYLIISGGGPGVMEASHLGAWLAGRTVADVDSALSMLAVAPSFRDSAWLASAFEVLEAFPQSQYKSLSVPTWLYGHEPPTIFATHIAKYFNNSIREDALLTEAYGGLIYMPGSAGTLQEIFQEAVQNHYLTFGYSSPMVFVGKQFWTENVPVWPFIQTMIEQGNYRNLILHLCDTTEEITEAILSFTRTPEEAES